MYGTVHSTHGSDIVARWKLEVLGCVVHHAQPYGISPADYRFEDLIQQAWLGVLRAHASHNPVKGPLEPYVRVALSNAVKGAIAVEARLDKMFESAESEASAIPSDEDGPDRRVERDETARLVRHWLSHQPHRLVTIYELIYVQGLTQREVAQILGVSQPMVSRLHRRSLAAGRDQSSLRAAA